VFFLGYFTTPLPPFLRGILYAIHRITRLNKMKIPIQSRMPDVPEGLGVCCGKVTHPFIVRLSAHDEVPSF